MALIFNLVDGVPRNIPVRELEKLGESRLRWRVRCGCVSTADQPYFGHSAWVPNSALDVSDAVGGAWCGISHVFAAVISTTNPSAGKLT